MIVIKNWHRKAFKSGQSDLIPAEVLEILEEEASGLEEKADAERESRAMDEEEGLE